jgi:hypothetical protein
MRDKPTGLDEDQLISALFEGWGMRVESAEYLPVGAGSYHWSVADRNGIVWFVKVDDLRVGESTPLDVFYGLRQSLTTALSLHREAGLGFIVTPIPATDGALLRRPTPRYALSVFPMVDGNAGEFGPHGREDLAEMVTMLADLHRATPVVAHLAPRTDLRLPGRERLHEALRDLDHPWTGGPHAEPARKLLIRHQARVRRWLTDFDRLVGLARYTAPGWVVTHGEPHPGNVIQTSDGMRLIDWTTVQIAPPERDLWMLHRRVDLLRIDPVRHPVGVSAVPRLRVRHVDSVFPHALRELHLVGCSSAGGAAGLVASPVAAVRPAAARHTQGQQQTERKSRPDTHRRLLLQRPSQSSATGRIRRDAAFPGRFRRC